MARPKSFKYEPIAQVGDRIRAYDFAGRTDCYIEGVVLLKDTKDGDLSLGGPPTQAFAAYLIIVDKDVWRGLSLTSIASGSRVGLQTFVPMEIGFDMDWDGRVVNLTLTRGA